MAKVHPYIDERLVQKIKVKFPEETCMLGIAATVEWALKRLLNDKGCVVGEQKTKEA